MGQILYQYTDAQALAGIVKDCAIRATDFRYLNDSLELSYVWDEFVARLRSLSETEDDDQAHAYLVMLDAIQRLKADDIRTYDQGIFVACFTELRDAVSQWSRYGANGHGVALGFDVEKMHPLRATYHYHFEGGELSPVLDQNHDPVTWSCFLEQVGYGDAKRDALVERLVGNVGGFGTTGDADVDAYNYMNQVSGIIPQVPLVKHAAFEDEREHRILASEHFGGMTAQRHRAAAELRTQFPADMGVPKTTLDVKFRPSAATLFTPYVEVPLPRDALATVVLGPSVTDALAPATVKRLLERHGYYRVEVEKSELPYQS